MLESAEATGLRPDHIDPDVLGYVEPARQASAQAYSVVFIAVAVLAVIGALVVAGLVRKAHGGRGSGCGRPPRALQGQRPRRRPRERRPAPRGYSPTARRGASPQSCSSR